jgi:hypothetical protein
MPPVPPPLPPTSSTVNIHAPSQQVPRPIVPNNGPSGALLLHLAIHSGGTFKNHWGYFIRSGDDPNLGNIIHVVGDVKNGFEFEVKRNHDFETTSPAPLHVIPLQWVDGRFFNEAMLNNGHQELDDKPACPFERSVYKVKPPTGSLNSARSVGQLLGPINTQNTHQCNANVNTRRTPLKQELFKEIVRPGSWSQQTS